MTANVVHVRASRAAIRDALMGLPGQALAGGAAADAMMMRVGLAALGRIKTAFVTKARGGTDEAGDRWAPLKPSTIAYSRRGRTKTERKRDAHPSQALNAKQQTRWWDLYRRGLAMYAGDKGHAAARAWFVLKSEGAKTLFDKYAHRSVEILRDTGLLLNSLSPGTGSADQVFRTGRGEVVVGTNRKGAKFHHEGTRRMPHRRLWPPPKRWPANWWLDITEAIKAGLIQIALQAMRDAR